MKYMAHYLLYLCCFFPTVPLLLFLYLFRLMQPLNPGQYRLSAYGVFLSAPPHRCKDIKRLLVSFMYLHSLLQPKSR